MINAYEVKILDRVMNATTSNGETDTAQWMTMDARMCKGIVERSANMC